jgi:DNA modification methylase
MQREKNTEQVLRCLRETGWTFQNLIVWRKLTSAVPCANRFGKEYQIIAFVTKGKRASVFHRLRIDPPPRPGHKLPRENGVFVTDCWDDIRELTSGYFAGDEAIRTKEGERAHKQQSPVALLLRILLASSRPGDWVLDPFAGSGTTAVVAQQLRRNSVSIEIDPNNVRMIKDRIEAWREADSVARWRNYYRFTSGIESIWPLDAPETTSTKTQKTLFEPTQAYGNL